MTRPDDYQDRYAEAWRARLKMERSPVMVDVPEALTEKILRAIATLGEATVSDVGHRVGPMNEADLRRILHRLAHAGMVTSAHNSNVAVYSLPSYCAADLSPDTPR